MPIVYEYRPEPKPLPAWAKALSLLKADGEVGLGDTIERIVGPIGGEAFKKWAKSKGFSCGCSQRKRHLNKRFPYT